MLSPDGQSGTPPDLREALAAHQEYLKGVPNRQPADLSGANLSGADLSGANLAKALLNGANLRSANLAGSRLVLASLESADLESADLAEAILDKANLKWANLESSRLEDSSLREAVLTGVAGLSARQLRGADVTFAKLPTEIDDSLKALPVADDATRTSSKVFLTMLAACLYCWLTILSTTDAALLVGTSSLALPIVQTPIPIVAFFGAAPMLLLIIYLYLHFSLQNLWDALSTLPAVFPDGRPVHEHTLPWILSPIPRVYFKRLAPSCPALAKFQVRATALLMWWGIPFTLLAFFGRYLVREDPAITSLQIAVTAVAVWLSFKFWRITKTTLRGNVLKTRRAPALPEALAGVLTGAVLGILAVGCFKGLPQQVDLWSVRTAAPHVMSLLGWRAFGDLSGKDLSRKPNGWDGKNLDAVEGAQLQGRSLRNVLAHRAFGVKASFVGADLRGADFTDADLRGADFSQASFDNTSFGSADLRGATFAITDLSRASLVEANIQGADFSDRVDDLGDIDRARNWPLAFLEPFPSQKLGLCPPNPNPACEYTERLRRRDFSGLDLSKFLITSFYRPDLSGANLQHAKLPPDLRGADLSQADLRNATFAFVDLEGADLTGADIRGADLTAAWGVTRRQIESALADGAKLPPYLESQKPFSPKK